MMIIMRALVSACLDLSSTLHHVYNVKWATSRRIMEITSRVSLALLARTRFCARRPHALHVPTEHTLTPQGGRHARRAQKLPTSIRENANVCRDSRGQWTAFSAHAAQSDSMRRRTVYAGKKNERFMHASYCYYGR